ncbi:hypothetical protein NB055_003887, partial [Escherichia coli]
LVLKWITFIELPRKYLIIHLTRDNQMRATVIIDDAQDGKNNSCRTAATSSRPVKKTNKAH